MSWEEEADQPLASFAGRLATNTVLASGDPLDGMAALFFETRLKRRHIALLWGVYVRPPARGTGLARALVEAAIETARGGAEHLRLTVGTHNAAAERLYRSLGFTEYGIEPAGRRVGGRDIHDRLMTLDLTAPG